mmetsp:Transcript_23146/g.28692  ORF Transcript_23146/g.28692 Transcript_23146/m.28692 type:complete len:281 (+) Transcript_23146:1374-2216(+)
MDVKGAEADIRKIGLTASIAHVIAIWRLKILIIRELGPRVQHLVSVHDLGTLIEVRDRFFVIACVDGHHSTIKVVVFLVKDVFFVVVCLFDLFCVSGVVAAIGTLGSCGASLDLAVKFHDFISVKVADIFELILIFSLLGLLEAEAQIIAFRAAVSVGAILLLAAANGPNLVDLGPLGAGDHLRVAVQDRGVVHDLRQVLVVFLRDQLRESCQSLTVRLLFQWDNRAGHTLVLCILVLRLGSLAGASRRSLESIEALTVSDRNFIVGCRLKYLVEVFKRL